jgi:hypothetical protein
MSTLASQASQSAGPSQSDSPGQSPSQSAGGGPGGAGAGQSAGGPPPAPRARVPGWSAAPNPGSKVHQPPFSPIARAYRGDQVFVAARLFGYTPGVPVTFKIFPATGAGDSSKVVATVKDTSDATGLASAQWQVKYDPARQDDPRLIFEATAGSASATSPILLISDFAELTLKRENGSPLANTALVVTDSVGVRHVVKTDANGWFRVQPIAIGKFTVALADHLADGEKTPASRKFDSGTPVTATLKRMVYTIEFQEPKDGDVYLTGHIMKLKAQVKRDGKPEPGTPTFRVSGTASARLIEAPPSAKGDASPEAALGRDPGDVTILAEYQGTRAAIKVKVVAPHVTKFELVDNGGNLFHLYHHEEKGAVPAHWHHDPAGKKPKIHGGAVRMGTKLKAKLTFAAGPKLTQPAKLNVAIATPPLAPTSRYAPKGAPAAAPPASLVFRLPQDKQGAGVDWTGDKEVALDLETEVALPAFVRAYEWPLEVRRAPPGRIGGPQDAAAGAGAAPQQKGAAAGHDWQHSVPIAHLDRLHVFAVWGKPAIGEGKITDPGTEPLAKSHFDPFHVRYATRAADGGWNLTLDDPGSIPRLLQRGIRHYAWPHEYEWKEGRPASAHPRPKNAASLAGEGLADAPVPVRGIAAGRCARCKTPTRGLDQKGCWHCRANHMTGFFRWQNAMYVADCGHGIGQGLFYDPSKIQVRWVAGSMVREAAVLMPAGGAPASWKRIEWCPVDHWPKVYLEVQCSACHQWVDEKDFLTGKHVCPEGGGGDPTAQGREATAHNWGFGVLDNPDTPGGKPHQIASAMAAALNALGVKASVVYLRRAGGAVNRREHDPVTVGSACFNAARDWGASLAAFVSVPVDNAHDQDMPNLKLHEQETIVFDPPLRGGERRAATATEAKMTGHARKIPQRDKLLAPQCRCGHSLAQAPNAPPWKTTIPIAGPHAVFQIAAGGTATVSGNATRTVGGRRPIAASAPVAVYVDGAFRGTVQGGGSLTFPLAPGSHQASFQVAAAKGARYQGQLNVSVQGAPETDVIVSTPVNARNPVPNRATNAQLTAVQTTVETDGDLRAIFHFAPNHSARLFMNFQVDSGPIIRSGMVDPGNHTGEVNLGPVAPGRHTVKVWPGNMTWKWVYWQGAMTVVGRKKRPQAHSCPTCGAQPKWSYACVKCKQTLPGDHPTGTHSCGQKLDALVESIVYPCPNCKKTVQDEDTDCWSCGTKLSGPSQKGWK